MLKFRGQIFFAMLWLVMTLAMAGWWLMFSLAMMEKVGALDPDFAGHKKMLVWEGLAWMILLLVGGCSLMFFIFRDRKNLNQVRQFVASFTHDLKTSLASLRLQVESLKEDLRSKPEEKLADRLVSDTLRLQLQLENSLMLASDFKTPFFLQSLTLSEVIERLRERWPSLKLTLVGDSYLLADQNAFEMALSNLIQNAMVHGKSSNLAVKMANEGDLIRIEIEDDGKGFSGDHSKLGRLFERHNPSSGSGVGLYIVKNVLQKMEGRAEFYPAKSGGFGCRIYLRGQEK